MFNRLVLITVVSVFLVLVGSFDLLGAQRVPSCRVKGDPIIPGVASFFIPGIGQFMNGDDAKGFTHLVVKV